MAKSFQIKVPASSANIGPGFDVLGVGLQLYLTIRVTIDPTIDTSSDPHNAIITYEGNLAEKVPLQSDKNLITQAALYLLRWLGSSASAIVGGIYLGNIIGDFSFDKIRMLDYCLMIERHPDNIAAAMLGGFIGSYLNELGDEETEQTNVPLDYILPTAQTPPQCIVSNSPPTNIGEYLQYNWNKKIKCVCIVPNFEVSTDKSRSVLPQSYTRPDIVYNLQRIAILTTALTQDPPNHKLIYQSMKDKIHQPYRTVLIPGLDQVLEEVVPKKHSGLCGICLSGAGPTILCLATDGFEEIAKDVIDIFAKEGIHCDWKLLDLAYDGATVEYL
ncbi:unnamed protein product [Candida parapsilosis]